MKIFLWRLRLLYLVNDRGMVEMFIEKMRDYAIGVLSFSWPMVVISIIVAISVRIAYLIINKQKFVIYEELFKLFFLVYILCLFQVVTYRDVNLTGNNFIPFKEILRYSIGSSLFYKNVFGNMILFLPYGIFISYYVKTDKWYTAFILAFIASISIECIQLLIGRVFDIDDVILNVFGALLGFGLYRIFYKIQDKIPNLLTKEIILDILSIMLLGGLVWFLVV